MTMYDVDRTELIEELAKELQNVENVTPPAWASFVKTGTNRERPPARQDWWYVRAASILVKVRVRGPIGVAKLRILYGGLKNRGYQPEQFRKSSGNIIRKILQQLEKAELLKQDKKGVHKGRVVTPKGIKLTEAVAKKIGGNKPVEKKALEKKEVKVKKPKAEEKKTEEVKDAPKSQKSSVSEGLETKSQSEVKKEKVPKAEELAAKKE